MFLSSNIAKSLLNIVKCRVKEENIVTNNPPPPPHPPPPPKKKKKRHAFLQELTIHDHEFWTSPLYKNPRPLYWAGSNGKPSVLRLTAW